MHSKEEEKEDKNRNREREGKKTLFPSFFYHENNYFTMFKIYIKNDSVSV